jgi:predicted TIM-barrel fold metal-dependent hydrolase
MIDVHVHLAALPTADNGCHVSWQSLRRPVARLLLRRLQIDPADPAGSNRRYVDVLLKYVQTSRWVSQVVLLALDGVYDSRGHFDAGRTHFSLSNSYLLEVCRQHPEFLPAVSINPQRRDALDELDRCAAAGAVVVKWLPNAQCFDPAEPRYRPFYRRLAEYRLPLLTHSGHEFTLVAPDQSLGDPQRMRLALDEGVTVISAHGGSSGLPFMELHRATVLRLVRTYPHYYLDSSALCSPNRVAMALMLRHLPQLQERLLFGSDYPVPVIPHQFGFHIGLKKLWAAMREKNPLDRNALVQQALGYQFAALPRGTRLADCCGSIQGPAASGPLTLA